MLKNLPKQGKTQGISTGDYMEKPTKSNNSSVSSLFLHGFSATIRRVNHYSKHFKRVNAGREYTRIWDKKQK